MRWGIWTGLSGQVGRHMGVHMKSVYSRFCVHWMRFGGGIGGTGKASASNGGEHIDRFLGGLKAVGYWIGHLLSMNTCSGQLYVFLWTKGSGEAAAI